MSKLTRDILDLIYDRNFNELEEIPTEDLIQISKEDRLGIDARIKVVAELVGRLYTMNLHPDHPSLDNPSYGYHLRMEKGLDKNVQLERNTQPKP